VGELHTALDLTPTPRKIARVSINKFNEEDIELRCDDCMETEHLVNSEGLFNTGSTVARHGITVVQIEHIHISQNVEYANV
jgi:hypothetical protein